MSAQATMVVSCVIYHVIRFKWKCVPETRHGAYKPLVTMCEQQFLLCCHTDCYFMQTSITGIILEYLIISGICRNLLHIGIFIIFGAQ